MAEGNITNSIKTAHSFSFNNIKKWRIHSYHHLKQSSEVLIAILCITIPHNLVHTLGGKRMSHLYLQPLHPEDLGTIFLRNAGTILHGVIIQPSDK